MYLFSGLTASLNFNIGSTGASTLICAFDFSANRDCPVPEYGWTHLYTLHREESSAFFLII